jgi:hypothetical protein
VHGGFVIEAKQQANQCGEKFCGECFSHGKKIAAGEVLCQLKKWRGVIDKSDA